MNTCECLSGKRILVAEDNELNLEILVDFLNDHGASVDIAKNGVELLELFSNCCCCHYDLILTDERMPYMNGTEAIAEMRRIPRRDALHVPIIVVSSDHLSDVNLKAKNAGADCTLEKPYNFTNLCFQIEKLSKEKDIWKHQPSLR